jgi:hypothetical protein
VRIVQIAFWMISCITFGVLFLAMAFDAWHRSSMSLFRFELWQRPTTPIARIRAAETVVIEGVVVADAREVWVRRTWGRATTIPFRIRDDAGDLALVLADEANRFALSLVTRKLARGRWGCLTVEGVLRSGDRVRACGKAAITSPAVRHDGYREAEVARVTFDSSRTRLVLSNDPPRSAERPKRKTSAMLTALGGLVFGTTALLQTLAPFFGRGFSLYDLVDWFFEVGR